MLFQTVTAVNYLPITFVLARSLKTNIPSARLCVLVTDASPAIIDKLRAKFSDLAEFIGCDETRFAPLKNMRRFYSVFEFSSACKVIALDYQLRVKNEPECCFVDPDMLVTGDFTHALTANSKDFVVTYHTRNPYPLDGELPTEMELVTTGAINGGLIYVRRSARALEALQWLAEQTRFNWFAATSHGMFCDQHWLGFMPQFFDDITGILHNPGVNIAYWNLHERPLSKNNGAWLAAGEPALLFHFSGFPNKDNPRLTKHSKRLFDAKTESCLTELVANYRGSLEKEGALIAKTSIAGDLGFNTQSLPKRMRAAEQFWNIRFVQVAAPVGFFARLGHWLDRRLRQ